MEHKTPKHIVAVAGYLTNEKDEVLLAKSTLAMGYMGVARRTGRRRRSASIKQFVGNKRGNRINGEAYRYYRSLL